MTSRMGLLWERSRAKRRMMPLLEKFQDVASGEADGQKGAKTSHRPGNVAGFRRGEAEGAHL